MRILVWLALAFLVYLALRKNFGSASDRSSSKQASSRRQGFPQQSSDARSEAMVCCAFCQMYLPASEAVHHNSNAFCSLEHAQQFTQKS